MDRRLVKTIHWQRRCAHPIYRRQRRSAKSEYHDVRDIIEAAMSRVQRLYSPGLQYHYGINQGAHFKPATEFYNRSTWQQAAAIIKALQQKLVGELPPKQKLSIMADLKDAYQKAVMADKMLRYGKDIITVVSKGAEAIEALRSAASHRHW